MRVYFELRKLEVDEFVVNTIVNTFTQYLEKRRFNIYTSKLAFSEEKKSYWEIKKDRIKKIEVEELKKSKEYRQKIENEHNDILENFIDMLKTPNEEVK